jgi:F-type H+-transporting ATPase subunit a
MEVSERMFLFFVGKTNADVKISLLSLFGSRASQDSKINPMNNPSLVLYGHATSSDIQFMLSSNSSTSSSSTGSIAESAPPEYTELFNQVCGECTRLVVRAGKQIPPQWDMPDLLRTVVITDNEDIGVIQPFLRDTYYDLMLCGPNSWVIQDIMAWIDLVNAESPLDQFSIHPIIPLNIDNYYFSFTNPSLSMLLTLGLVLLLLFVITKKGGGKSVPNAWQSLVELIYDFVPNLVNEQIGGISGNVKQKFFPCISVTFTFSLFRNPQGMIPFSFTVTSHFLITLALSFSIFIGITIVGFQRHGLHFFSFLLPAGVPLPLAPFLVLLELISHCFRALSSGIRLFANMMAGHSSVKILSGFAWTMLFLNNIFYFIGDLGPLFIVLALTGLELGVAISQAHVSTISICIYLNDATNLHQNE